jgi:tetratricopeptide (TPR) repeat protein
MGLLRRIQNRLAESQMQLETAIALDRNNARAYLQLGHTLRSLGQPEAAIPHIEKAIRLNPRDRNVGTFYFGLGQCHLLLGHVDEAIYFLRKARAANPRLSFWHLWLAGALGLRGDLDEAEAALAEAIKLKPEVNSLARQRANLRYNSNPQYLALAQTTLYVGLRRAGMPEE